MSIRKGSVYIAGNNISIDGDTISYNSNNSLQSLGNINKNIAVGSVDKLFDWVGTTAQYIAQDIETLHPEWICYITDDQGTGVGAVYNTAQADARFFKKNDDTDSITISGLGMPDITRCEDLTILASNTIYTSPANGWYSLRFTGSGQAGFNDENLTCKLVRVNTPSGNVGVLYPVLRGEKVNLFYSSGIRVEWLKFMYAVGDTAGE